MNLHFKLVKKKIKRCCRRMRHEGKWDLIGSNQFLSYLQHLRHSCVILLMLVPCLLSLTPSLNGKNYGV